MFETLKNESMKNVIAYVTPRNKTMEHSMILNNSISCVVGISILGFKIYWKQVFNLMEIKTTPTFKQFLKAETLNAEKNKSYYQLYDVKRLRSFHKEAIMRQHIYENMLARRSGVDYIPEIHSQKIIINMEEAKSLTTRNQLEKKQQNRCRCVSINHLRVISKDCSVGLSIRKAKKSYLGMGISQPEENKSEEYIASEEESKCLAAEANGEGEKLYEGASAVNKE